MTTSYPSAKRLSRKGFLAHFLALRPRHWTKNLIVFAALLFDFGFSPERIAHSLFAFVAFCAISSSFYLFNDIVDIESDRRHPVKCKRPIAAGLVPVPTATVMAFCLLSVSIAWGLIHSAALGATLIGYALLQFAYNLRLKRLVLLDIITIASGFVLRAFAGAVSTGITLSVWFLVCTAMLALFLAIEKRKAELRQGGSARSVLKRYSPSLLLRLENVATTGTLMSYALWSAGLQIKGATTPWMMLTFPFVLYGVFRYQLLSDPKENWQIDSPQTAVTVALKERTERPEEVLLSDRPLLITVLAWAVVAFSVLWLEHNGIIH